MNLDYLSHFGLSAEPFSKDIGDADLWMPPSKQSLVEDLTEAMHTRASALLTGEPGVGKTCVLRALRHALTPANFRLVYCQNTTVGRRDFYRFLCLALGIAKAATAGDLFIAVASHIEELAKERIAPVLLVDEAHLLHQDTLDHLHILLNYQWDSKPLLSLVLIGLPDLEDRLRLRRNRSLYSRLHHRFSIGGVVPDDTMQGRISGYSGARQGDLPGFSRSVDSRVGEDTLDACLKEPTLRRGGDERLMFWRGDIEVLVDASSDELDFEGSGESVVADGGHHGGADVVALHEDTGAVEAAAWLDERAVTAERLRRGRVRGRERGPALRCWS